MVASFEMSITSKIVVSLRCAPETNVPLCVNYTPKGKDMIHLHLDENFITEKRNRIHLLKIAFKHIQ